MSKPPFDRDAFLLSVLVKIESLKEGIICISHSDQYPDGSLRWHWIAVNDYELYAHDKRFKTFSAAYRKAAQARGLKLVFCYSTMSEENLLKLANENDLLMNI